MSDDVWQRAEIESPCVKICAIHPATGFCIGCYRTTDEITVWSRISGEARREIMAALPERKDLIREAGLARRRARREGRAEQ